MENLLRNGVDLQSMYNAKTINGDAHFFEDVTTPAKVRQYLDSFQVNLWSVSLLMHGNLNAFDFWSANASANSSNFTNPNTSSREQEADKIKGMKLLLAMLSKGKDIPDFFPEKVVHIYLVLCAAFNNTCRKTALLSAKSLTGEAHSQYILISCKVCEPSFQCYLVVVWSIAWFLQCLINHL